MYANFVYSEKGCDVNYNETVVVAHDPAETGNPFTYTGVTPLMLAVEGNFRDAVEILLSQPDIGKTAFYKSIWDSQTRTSPLKARLRQPPPKR